MELNFGRTLAAEIIGALQPYCERIEVVGSIRRKKRFPRDIDIVCIPRDPWGMNNTIAQLGQLSKNGPKIKSFSYKGAQVDLYLASVETWATLLLIRTGSTQNNIRLCRHARGHGMVLHADGSGLFKLEVTGGDLGTGDEGKEVRIAGDSEEGIYAALALPFQRPEERG
jgi:DNA polymerase (family 10)